jgi:tRNA pseudouridine55 synthase
LTTDDRSDVRPSRRNDACGVIVYDKPAGITSHDVVAAVRRRLGRALKVGHAGTLDPFATGVLLVLVGRATRVQRFLMALPKRYRVVARFGATSTTGDPEGEIVETGLVPDGDLSLPVGRVRQRPPAYSAVKVSGRRAYALARAGHELALPEREVEVYRFDELWRSGDRRGFEIECSSGTYVRSLVADLGDAYCEELRRTAIGPFAVEDADPERVISLDEALAFLPEQRLDPEDARRAAHGAAVPLGRNADYFSVSSQSPVVRLTDDQGLIAIAEPRDDGRVLKPIVGLRPGH